MQSWEYAEFLWEEGRQPSARRYVAFTHHDPLELDESDRFWPTLRKLGEDGWELVSTTQILGGTLCWLKRPLV
jgi:hypothetical protein